MRDLLNHEKGPDASDNHQIDLHVLFTVRVAMIMMVMMIMVVTMVMIMIVMVFMVVMFMASMVVAMVMTAPTKMRNCMEEDITEQASHCEREQYIGEAFACSFVPHDAHVHRVDEEDGYDGDENGRDDRLRNEWKWTHIPIHNVKYLVSFCHLDHPLDKLFVPIAAMVVSMVMVMIVIVMVMKVMVMFVTVMVMMVMVMIVIVMVMMVMVMVMFVMFVS